MNLLDNQNLRWKRYTGKPQFGYPVDCSGAVLEANCWSSTSIRTPVKKLVVY